MKGEEYHPDCIESTFIPEFKRIKIWGAIRYGKKSKLVIINEDLERDHKFNAETYLKEILDKEFFDFWMETMEDRGHIWAEMANDASGLVPRLNRLPPGEASAFQDGTTSDD